MFVKKGLNQVYVLDVTNGILPYSDLVTRARESSHSVAASDKKESATDDGRSNVLSK